MDLVSLSIFYCEQEITKLPKNLKSLSLVECVFNPSILDGQSQLTHLILHLNQLKNIDFLKQMPLIKNLGISTNWITDLTPLSSLSNLKILDMSDNPLIRNFDVLQNLELDFLNVSMTFIESTLQFKSKHIIAKMCNLK